MVLIRSINLAPPVAWLLGLVGALVLLIIGISAGFAGHTRALVRERNELTQDAAEQATRLFPLTRLDTDVAGGAGFAWPAVLRRGYRVLLSPDI